MDEASGARSQALALCRLPFAFCLLRVLCEIDCRAGLQPRPGASPEGPAYISQYTLSIDLRRLLQVKARGILVRLRQSQQFRFAERPRKERDVRWRAGGAESVRHVDRRIARQVRHRRVSLRRAWWSRRLARTATPTASALAPTALAPTP